MDSVRSCLSTPPRLSHLPPSSSTSSSSRPEIKYDVFLSFRGEDTRNTLTSHLHKALCDKGIDVFIDYELRRGDEISPSLLQAIEESLISIVIFSKNYADSRWCLEELVKILDCKRYHGQIVIPVFHDIDPSHVRNQTESYAVAFAGHQIRFKEDLDIVQKWRCALREAANLSGLDSRVLKPESELVESIVEDVLKWLNSMPPCDNQDLIGIDSSIEELEAILWRGSVGIWGIGGIGKTTLAKALFEKISYQFDRFYFADSVREASKQDFGLNYLRRRLFSTLLGDKNAFVGAFRKRSQRKKFLIILDDVSDYAQVKSLIGDPWCLDSKCQIIITSRNKQVLRNCCMDDNIYEVKELCFSDALKLFCQNAFRQNRPNVDYKELSNSIVKMVGGIPLAITVLGSSLLGKKKEVWESAMEKLEKNFDRNIHEVLKISYEELDDDEQNIFLDITCFFKWWDIDIVKAFMKACGFFPDSGIDSLIDKSLITISKNIVMMHDLLQAMGKEIVRQESTNDPGKRSRLWHHKDIYDVLTNETGTETLEGISLNMSKSKDMYLHPHAFANMQNLRFLHFYVSKYCENRVHVPQGLQSIFTKLRYLHWYGYPLKSLQSNFHSKNLVVLEMRDSEVRELWSGVPQLENLKIIDLIGSEHLTSLPDFSKAPNLASLDLEFCTSLTEIPSSIQYLPKLQRINMFGCKNLMSIPDCSGLKFLKHIAVEGCYKLKVLPGLANNFEELSFADCTSLCEIPSSYKCLNKLKFLSFDGCKSLSSVPDYSGLKSLTELIIRCPKVKMLPEFPNNIEKLQLIDLAIEELPSSLENLCRLHDLDLSGCSKLRSLPNSVCKWKSLGTLRLKNCSKINKLPDDIGTLESLRQIEAEGTITREVPSSFSCLKSLDSFSFSGHAIFPSLIGLDNLLRLRLSNSGIIEIPDCLGSLTSLKFLDLDKNNFVSIPESIINLSKLVRLDISYCKKLKVLPKLPWANIIAVDCTSLEEISFPSFNTNMLPLFGGATMVANLINCLKLDRNSLNNFMKDTLLEIQREAASTKKGYHHQVYRGYAPPITIRYPDNEIPVWFDYQSSSSFIDVNLPSNWFNYNFLCFAFCVVVAIPDGQSVHYDENFTKHFYVRCECNIKSKDGDCQHAEIDNMIFWDDVRLFMIADRILDSGRICLRSNHVYIGFGFHFFGELHGNQLSFQFSPLDLYPSREPGKGLNVEKCGVHLMYGQHLEISDEEEEDEPHLEEFDKDNKPHLVESDEEYEPHPKRHKG